jgi:hypothetical protein
MFRDTENLPVQESRSDEARQLRTLAALVRRGCLIIPIQAVRQSVSYDGSSACALGAAAIALGINHSWSAVMGQLFSVLTNNRHELWDAIVDMNDNQGQTREAIADWLDQEAAKR